MKLDDLDDRLLKHFKARFPKPETLNFCDYDVDREEVDKLCKHPRPFEVEGLIGTFVGHNRLGMFGYWQDFPPFAGDVAVFCRRGSLSLEYDLAFFHLHASKYGEFDAQDTPILMEWLEDILMPWRRTLEREELLWWSEHALGYLSLYCTFDGDAKSILAENIKRSEETQSPTELVKALKDFLTENEEADEGKVRRRLGGMAKGHDNQVLPGTDFVSWSSITNVIATIKNYEGLIAIYGE